MAPRRGDGAAPVRLPAVVSNLGVESMVGGDFDGDGLRDATVGPSGACAIAPPTSSSAGLHGRVPCWDCGS